MAKKDTPETAEQAIPPREDRVDEYAQSMFAAAGFTGELPDSLVKVYDELKIRKDRIYPGRMSPEGFAFVILLSDWISGKVDLKGPTQAG